MTVCARNIPGDAEKKCKRVCIFVWPTLHARHHLPAATGAAVGLRIEVQRQAALG